MALCVGCCDDECLIHLLIWLCLLQDFVNKVVNPDFAPPGPDGKRGKLILLGGIQVNMPHPMKDFFQPLMFEAR